MRTPIVAARSKPRRAPEPADRAAGEIERLRHALAIRLFLIHGLAPCRSGRCVRMWCRRHGRCRQIADAARLHPDERWPEVRVAGPSRKDEARRRRRLPPS